MLKPSPRQLSIVKFLKAPGTSPEDYARQQGISVKTVYVQLGRLRAKDDDARKFHAWFNGVMGSNPNLLPYMKGIDQLGQKAKDEVAHDLQEPERRGSRAGMTLKSVKKQHEAVRAKSNGATKKKAPNAGHRTP